MDEYDFSTTETGASDTIPIEAGQIKKGGLIMIKDQPCRVSNVSTSKTGKHGSAKCNFTANNIFNNKKLEEMLGSSHATATPVLTRKEYTLMDINEEGYVTLLDDDGDTREDIKLPDYPEDYCRTIQKEFDDGKQLIVTVVKACGHEQIMHHKIEA
jgi:translation initiation factor 5A